MMRTTLAAALLALTCGHGPIASAVEGGAPGNAPDAQPPPAQAAATIGATRVPTRRARDRRRRGHFRGHAVPQSAVRSEPPERPSGDLELISINRAGDVLRVNLYEDRATGELDEDALAQLYHFWRCRRSGTERPIDPRLFEKLSIIYDHFKAPIELISGFRNQDRTSSYHFVGSAADIRVAGVSPEDLYVFVSTIDAGHQGLGRYPRSGFVHVDVRPRSYRWVDRSPPRADDPSRPSAASSRPTS